MHKKAAYCLLIGGFVWISVICVEFFDAPQRRFWIGRSEPLRGGSAVPREVAIAGLRGLQKDLERYYDQLFIAGFLMLVGGVVNGINVKREVTKPDNPTNGIPPSRSE